MSVTLTLSRNGTTATRTWTNAKADPVLLGAVKRRGYTGGDLDAQAILDFLHKEITDQIVTWSKSQELQEIQDASTINLD